MMVAVSSAVGLYSCAPAKVRDFDSLSIDAPLTGKQKRDLFENGVFPAARPEGKMTSHADQ